MMGCATSVDGHIFFSGRGIDPCAYCGVAADYLCDFPLGGGATCSALLCRRHAVDQPHSRVRLDYCPPHDAIEKDKLCPTWTQRRDKALHESLSQRLNGRPYATFLKAEKDDVMDPEPFMPNGFKECHGFCLTVYGNVYSFWFGWDGQRPAITEWDAVDPSGQPWAKTIAYREARTKMGIGIMLIDRQRQRRARRFVKA